MNIVDMYYELDKEYMCPRCFKSSTLEKWSNATKKDFGKYIIDLETCLDNIRKGKDMVTYDSYDHTCPKCNHCSYTRDIVKATKR